MCFLFFFSQAFNVFKLSWRSKNQRISVNPATELITGIPTIIFVQWLFHKAGFHWLILFFFSFFFPKVRVFCFKVRKFYVRNKFNWLRNRTRDSGNPCEGKSICEREWRLTRLRHERRKMFRWAWRRKKRKKKEWGESCMLPSFTAGNSALEYLSGNAFHSTLFARHWRRTILFCFLRF